MKRFLFLFGILLIVNSGTKAQQLPLFSQYIENGFLLNPAMAGNRQFAPLRLSMRQQWLGVDDAPETYALSYHTNLGKVCTTCPVYGNPLASRNNKAGVGVGGYIFNDSYGAVSRTGLELAYAYHLRLTSDNYGKAGAKLAFGLGGMFYQYKFDGTDIPVNDPLYTGAVETSFVPDANFGVYLYNDDYFVGLSVMHLFESTIKFGDDHYNDNLLDRHLYAMAGYTFHLSELVDLEPSVMLRRTFTSDNYLDASAKLYILNFWMAASYRNQNQYVGMIGVNYDRFYFGYTYDHYLDNLVADSSNGTHEITIGINLNVPESVLRRNQSKIRRASYRSYSRSQKKSYRRSHKKFLFF